MPAECVNFLRLLIKPAKLILLVYLLQTPVTVAGENVPMTWEGVACN